MSRIVSCILLLSLSWLLPQASVAGPIIYDNGVTVETGFFAAGTPLFFADNFQLATGQTTVADVHWRGIYASPTLPPLGSPPDLFAIRIHQENPNPAILAPIGGGLLQLSLQATRTDTGTLLGALHIFEYSVNLPSPITLLADTTYWLSIDYLAPLADSAWLWGTQLVTLTPNAGHAFFTSTSGSSWAPAVSQSGMMLEMDFQLTGPPTDVPEPASLALFGLGLAGLALSRRKRG